MNDFREKYHRHSLRLRDYDYSQSGAYFITICTKNKECLLGEIINGKTPLVRLSPVGKIVRKFWLEIPEHFPNVELDEFVIMPNHIHGIIIIKDSVGAIHELPLLQLFRRKMLIPKIVGWYKMRSAKHINTIRRTPGMSVWQRNYYEHIIRNEESLNRIREYIINNPIKWEIDKENPKNISRKVIRNSQEKTHKG